MKQLLHEISLDTKAPVEFIDITDAVSDACARSGIADGIVNVFTRHTTTAVKVNEQCDRLQEDMIGFLERMVPSKAYRHDEDTVDSRANARGHIMSMLLGASETIPVAEKKLLLGSWQSIFFVELDGPRARRKVVVRIIGE